MDPLHVSLECYVHPTRSLPHIPHPVTQSFCLQECCDNCVITFASDKRAVFDGTAQRGLEGIHRQAEGRKCGAPSSVLAVGLIFVASLLQKILYPVAIKITDVRLQLSPKHHSYIEIDHAVTILAVSASPKQLPICNKSRQCCFHHTSSYGSHISVVNHRKLKGYKTWRYSGA